MLKNILFIFSKQLVKFNVDKLIQDINLIQHYKLFIPNFFLQNIIHLEIKQNKFTNFNKLKKIL